jgi:hypothetical protein
LPIITTATTPPMHSTSTMPTTVSTIGSVLDFLGGGGGGKPGCP